MIKETEFSESGSPVYKYEELNEEWIPPVFGDEEHEAKLDEHINKYLGESDNVWHEVLSNIFHLDVYHIKPSAERDNHTFITRGMSYLPMSVPEGCEDWQYSELMITLPSSWPVGEDAFKEGKHYWPIWLLKMLARFPHQHNTWISWGHTIPNGDPAEPYSPETDLCCALLLPPLNVPQEFLSCKINDQKTVKFLNVVPIYTEEMNYKLKHGIEPLYDKFDKYNINDVVSINRRNVCKRKLWPFGN